MVTTITPAKTLARMDAWFQTMRSDEGYTGPITHWWESCWLYSGPMLDWRYEGLLCGYVTLYEKTQNPLWLARALQAGNDLQRGQMPDGRFHNSSFQAGPVEGGTPHEAAADVGLLELARLLRSLDDPRWRQYFEVAEKNLRHYHLACLWDGKAFRDQPWNPTVVPNKNATTIEALLLLEALSGENFEDYIRSAAELILSAQITMPGTAQGGIVHLGTHSQRLAIGIYTARSASAMIRLYARDGDARYRRIAEDAGAFLLTLLTDQGTAFGYYPDGRLIANPVWLSPSGDVLRALYLLQPYSDQFQSALSRLLRVLQHAQMPGGGLSTAHGLGRKGHIKGYQGQPDFRDVLPVVGWCDKAFRALALCCDVPEIPQIPETIPDTELPCTWKGQACVYREDQYHITLTTLNRCRTLYRWRKGQHYPDECEL